MFSPWGWRAAAPRLVTPSCWLLPVSSWCWPALAGLDTVWTVTEGNSVEWAPGAWGSILSRAAGLAMSLCCSSVRTSAHAQGRPVAGSHYWLMSLWSGTGPGAVRGREFSVLRLETLLIAKSTQHQQSHRPQLSHCHQVLSPTCQHPVNISIENTNKENACHLGTSL